MIIIINNIIIYNYNIDSQHSTNRSHKRKQQTPTLLKGQLDRLGLADK